MIRVRWAAALAVLALAVSGCNGPGEKPLTHAQLEARLLTASTVPASARVTKLDDTGPSTPLPPEGLDCDSLVSLAFSFFDNKSTRPASVASVMIDSQSVDGGDLWRGNEFLISYHGDDAHKALADVRALVGTCPPATSNAITTTYQLGQDPAYGDEGLDLRAVLVFSGGSQMERQSAVVRVGSILIIITAATPLPEGSLIPTDELIKAAYERFTST